MTQQEEEKEEEPNKKMKVKESENIRGKEDEREYMPKRKFKNKENDKDDERCRRMKEFGRKIKTYSNFHRYAFSLYHLSTLPVFPKKEKKKKMDN